jgi:hypothetical protein
MNGNRMEQSDGIIKIVSPTLKNWNITNAGVASTLASMAQSL